MYKFYKLFFLLYSFSLLGSEVSHINKKRKLDEITTSGYMSSDSEESTESEWNMHMYSIEECYFSPKDNLKGRFIDLIKQETQKMQIAVYTFTDKQIAQELIESHNNQIKIEIIVDKDQSCNVHMYKILRLLDDNGIKIYYLDIKGLMHNKFCIFKKNNFWSKPLLWTGSYNLTDAANSKHRENAMLLDSIALVKSYKKEFKELKEEGKKIDLSILKVKCHVCSGIVKIDCLNNKITCAKGHSIDLKFKK